jgi:hypothetical protein
MRFWHMPFVWVRELKGHDLNAPGFYRFRHLVAQSASEKEAQQVLLLCCAILESNRCVSRASNLHCERHSRSDFFKLKRKERMVERFIALRARSIRRLSRAKDEIESSSCPYRISLGTRSSLVGLGIGESWCSVSA